MLYYNLLQLPPRAVDNALECIISPYMGPGPVIRAARSNQVFHHLLMNVNVLSMVCHSTVTGLRLERKNSSSAQ